MILEENAKSKLGNFNYGTLEIGKTYTSDVLPLSQTLGWQINAFNFPSVWSQTKGAGVKVAILDTGVDMNHPDLIIKGQYNFLDGAKGSILTNSYVPTISHGTHVAGIIGARNNTQGIIGVAPECDIYVCRVLGEDGSGYFSDIMDALDWCVTNKMDVINMSLGAGVDFQGFYEKIRKVYDAKIPIVCAAGNSSWESGYLSFPAVYDETIAVASLKENLTRSSFSYVGGNIDVAAPGSNILSTTPGNTYTVLSGTSMATPFVTGLVALLIAKHRTLGGSTPINNPEDVRDHLNKTATDLDFSGRDNYTGFGIVNPLGSLDYTSSTSQNVSSVTKTIKGSNKYYKIKYNPSENMSITVTTKVPVKSSQPTKKGAIITPKTQSGTTWVTKTEEVVFSKANEEKEISISDADFFALVQKSNSLK